MKNLYKQELSDLETCIIIYNVFKNTNYKTIACVNKSIKKYFNNKSNKFLLFKQCIIQFNKLFYNLENILLNNILTKKIYMKFYNEFYNIFYSRNYNIPCNNHLFFKLKIFNYYCNNFILKENVTNNHKIRSLFNFINNKIKNNIY